MTDNEINSLEERIRFGWLPDTAGEVTLSREITEGWVWHNSMYLQWWIDLKLLAGELEADMRPDADGSLHLSIGEIEIDTWTLAHRWCAGVGVVTEFLRRLQQTEESWQTIRFKTHS